MINIKYIYKISLSNIYIYQLSIFIYLSISHIHKRASLYFTSFFVRKK